MPRFNKKKDTKGRSGKQSHNYQDKFSKRERTKGFREGMEAEEKFESAKASRLSTNNDPQWYFKDKNVLDAVASFAYQHPLGDDLSYPNMMSSVDTGRYKSTTMSTIPGLLAMRLAITPGYSVDAQSPINLGAQDMYSFIRYKNSGAANYDPPDLMMYILAMDSLYSAWNWAKRIYGYASTYSQTNKYKPAAYAFADGIDLDDIYGHLADFRAYLNMAASRISAFAVPATMTYLVRHSWLFSNIYKDANSLKAQEYMFTPHYFFQFEEVAEQTGTSLTPIIIPTIPKTTSDTYAMSLQDAKASNVLWKFTDIQNLINGMINALQYSEDAGIMSGDIIKAFGSNLFSLSTFDADYKIESVYSQEVLMQIENASTTNLYPTKIVQDPDTNWIKYLPTNVTQTVGWNGAFLNFHKDNPSPEDVMVASRLTTALLGVDGSLIYQSIGSEVMTESYAIYLAQDVVPWSGTWQQGKANNMYGYCLSLNPTLENHGLKQIFRCYLWSAFDWAPSLRMIMQVGDGDDYTLDQLPDLRDWDIYVRLEYNNLEALHTLALLTEFNVPN